MPTLHGQGQNLPMACLCQGQSVHTAAHAKAKVCTLLAYAKAKVCTWLAYAKAKVCTQLPMPRWFDLLISIGSGGSIWFSRFGCLGVWARSMVIEAKLEVRDEGKVDGRRFPVLVVWSVEFTCGDRRWRVEEACGHVVAEDESDLVEMG
ncbi:hypothetical protein LWI29_019578 [Acer saccharum]|uniref:Uncharacterized protein n=1 Tax=Acer saccharum TaxID=4024 RepID=A0AA39RE82_ACESA|nr:hypothetical protein LWI29_019578 [Acer saccharum]